MRHHFDFVLWSDDITKIIFRFYPRQSHVHSFKHGEEFEKLTPEWGRVYKVYYSWAILEQTDYSKIDFQDSDCVKSSVLFSLHCDECSQLPNLAAIIRHVKKTGETYDKPTWGQPAGDWIVKKFEYLDWNDKPQVCFDFEVFNNYTDQGYRFRLYKKQTEEFIEWLEEINEYALQHWEEI